MAIEVLRVTLAILGKGIQSEGRTEHLLHAKSRENAPMLLGHADGVSNALVPEDDGLATELRCRGGMEREVGLNAPCARLPSLPNW